MDGINDLMLGVEDGTMLDCFVKGRKLGRNDGKYEDGLVDGL